MSEVKTMIFAPFQALIQLANRRQSTAAPLLRIVREVAQMDGFCFDQFLYYLSIYEDTKIAILSRRANASQLQQFKDNCETVRICLSGFHCRTLDLLCFEIETLFQGATLSAA